jgi:NAD kinase
MEQKHALSIILMSHVSLVTAFNANDDYIKEYGITKQLRGYTNLTEADKRLVSYIVTLGGDGTILYAAKQFNGDFIPPMITFAHGSLGFMANFVFEDHAKVFE